ncbi:MAG: helicase-related protein [Anaerolineales bacterium]|nr:MAG: helicase-related protein [Anaerolineales bacterium]
MPANAFITNAKSRTLKKRLDELIQHSKELKFLVGYFYFSGWRELYESLRVQSDLTIKLLVGLDVDKSLNRVFEIEKDGKELSNDELADRFFESLNIALNDESLDNQEFYEQVSYFLELLQNGRLQIKKTLEPNHAKLYFFKVKDEVKGLLPEDGKFITGSSNLTRAGIQGQNEFNVEISDYGTKEAEEYFDDLWNTAVLITDIPERKEYLTRFVQNKTQVAEVTPFEAYALVLKSYLDLAEQKSIKPHVKRLLEDQGYKDYQYQTDAVNQALTIIEQYNGVIIADVVGLGKSVIAGMLARNLGRRGMVVCPPGLMGDAKRKDSGWHKYLADFKLHDWEVRSSGDLEKAVEYLQEYGDDVEVVVVDEAHRFRNEDTADYELLSNICRKRMVILLTATPFNNSPQDIFTLLKLFIVPGKSKITLDENLEGRFARYNADFRRLSYILRYYDHRDDEKRARAEKYYDQMFEAPLPIDIPRVKERAAKLSSEIRAVLEPVLIRRNRLDLKNDPVYSAEVTELSEVGEPKEMFYALTPEQMDFYDRVINEYFSEDGRFRGAIYQPFIYEEHEALTDTDGLSEEENRTFQQQRNLYEFMRRLLVKRFESSFGAFSKSIANFTRVHERVLEFIDNSGGKYILDRKLIEKIYNSNPDDIDAALLEFERQLSELKKRPKNQHVYIINEFDLADEFVQDIKSDLDLMREIQQRIKRLNLVQEDPKAESLINEIEKIINTLPEKGEPKRKVIIFSEYIDTVEHLAPILEKAFPGKVLSTSSGLSAAQLRNILANFDASFKFRERDDTYQILLTSDKLSEGVNLNRAGTIINYDIPWNPTRVIQRVGRINRIGRKVFQNLYIYNFFPTEKGADIVKSREIASQKMFLIHNTLGEDAKIFAVDETPSPSELFKRVNSNPEDEEEQSIFTRVRRTYFEIQSKYPEIIERIKEFPARVKTAKAFSENQLLVFRRKGLGLFIQLVNDTTKQKPEIKSPFFEDTLQLIECEVDEPRRNLSENFWASYEAIKEYREVQHVPKSEAALENKALNNLSTALHNFKAELEDHISFIRVLIEDLRDYKTLAKSTLRRFAGSKLEASKPKTISDFASELQVVKNNLGEDYLEVVKSKLGTLKSEVIIAIENHKV